MSTEARPPSRPEGRDALIRAYAAGEASWRDLQWQGFDDFVEVLAGLDERGLAPPVAPMAGPNVEARRRGLAMLRSALAARR